MRPEPGVRGPRPSSSRTKSALLAGPPLPSARATWFSKSLGRHSGRTFLVALGAMLVLGAGPSSVSADTALTPEQQKAVIDQVRAQLGSNLADAMAAQQQLRQSLQDNATQQAALQDQIAAVEAKIADLDEQIAAAQRREADLAARIDTERAQLRQLARAIYEQPGSILVVLAEAQSLSDLLTRVADLNVAGVERPSSRPRCPTTSPSFRSSARRSRRRAMSRSSSASSSPLSSRSCARCRRSRSGRWPSSRRRLRKLATSSLC